MANILLCDDGNPRVVVRMAEKYGTGIEFGAFHKLELLDHAKHAIQEYFAYSDVACRALHGAFADLCPGSARACCCSGGKRFYVGLVPCINSELEL